MKKQSYAHHAKSTATLALFVAAAFNVSAQAQTAIAPSERPDTDKAAGSDSAAESQGDTPSSTTDASKTAQSSCAALFGDVPQVEQNEEQRTDALHAFDVTEDGWTIIHRVADWSTPKAAHFSNMEVVRTQKMGETQVAIVKLSGAWAERCGEEHVLKQDMSLGPNTQVLAIAEGAVLLDRGGELQSWAPTDAPPPERTQMVWRSDYSIVLAAQKSGRSKASSKKSKKAASSAAKRRAAARKKKKK